MLAAQSRRKYVQEKHPHLSFQVRDLWQDALQFKACRTFSPICRTLILAVSKLFQHGLKKSDV